MKPLHVPTGITLKTVLFATDFSESSAKALKYAAVVARRCGAKLITLHVSPPGKVSEKAAQQMQELAGTLNGLNHQEITQTGEIWSTIAAQIEKQNIDLLVVGSEGRSGLSQLAHGSMAEEIFRRASCPVMVVFQWGSAGGVAGGAFLERLRLCQWQTNRPRRQ